MSNKKPYLLSGGIVYRDSRYNQKMSGLAFGNMRGHKTYDITHPYNEGAAVPISRREATPYNIKVVIDEISDALTKLPDKEKFDRSVCVKMVSDIVSNYAKYDFNTSFKEDITYQTGEIKSYIKLEIPVGSYTNLGQSIIKSSYSNLFTGNGNPDDIEFFYKYKYFDDEQEAFHEQLKQDLKVISTGLYSASEEPLSSYENLIPKDWRNKENNIDFWKEVSPWVHCALDIGGLVPSLGEPFDAINAIVYGIEGDYANSALSAAAMIPFVGWVAPAGKAGKKVLKSVTSEVVAKALKEVLQDPQVKIIIDLFKTTGSITRRNAQYIIAKLTDDAFLSSIVSKIFEILKPLKNASAALFNKKFDEVVLKKITDVIETLPEVLKNDQKYIKELRKKLGTVFSSNDTITSVHLIDTVKNTIKVYANNADVKRVLEYLYKAANNAKDTGNGFKHLIGDFSKGGNWYTGAEWTLRHIDVNKYWKGLVRFEEATGPYMKRRIIDVKIIVGGKLTRFEFKSWGKFNKTTFLSQIEKDATEGVEKLKWIFEKRMPRFPDKAALVAYAKEVLDNSDLDGDLVIKIKANLDNIIEYLD